ncbi:LOW QUALITY PROTEIN: hypothetical protein PHMEG_0001225 [Phytophthora megakarya]|uniref:Uncharacterized protein n=1 Tax=Phytophthora megakarya TaxID=4795 RepID=A0A225X111_9STRA|nr:LOW QUALITY PROTEIN: hypothetical protein PHMEG_0001225 [Phytophthora megakarya]
MVTPRSEIRTRCPRSGASGIDGEHSTWHWKKLFKTSSGCRRLKDKITPFRGKLDESENSVQWLRGFGMR